MFDLIYAFREWLTWSRRKRELASRIRAAVETGKGDLRRVGSIGMLLKSPFKGIGGRPVYLKATCDYPDDRGVWLVRATDDGGEVWVWKSDYGRPELPPGAPPGATVDDRVVVLPFLITIVLWLLFIGGVVGVIVWL